MAVEVVIDPALLSIPKRFCAFRFPLSDIYQVINNYELLIIPY